jgi:hypothetical protein
VLAGGDDVLWITVKTMDDIAVIGSQRRSKPPVPTTYMDYQAAFDTGLI